MQSHRVLLHRILSGATVVCLAAGAMALTSERQGGSAAAPEPGAERRASSGVELLWDNGFEPEDGGGRPVSQPQFPNIRVVDDFVVGDAGNTWIPAGG